MIDEIDTLQEYYLSPDREFMFGNEVRRAAAAFMGRDAINTLAAYYFFDWFIFDFRFANEAPPVQRFISSNPLNLAEDRLKRYREFSEHNRFDFFSVEKTSGRHAVFESVRDSTRYEILLPKKSVVQSGDVIVCRIGRVDNQWRVLFPTPLAMSSPSARDKLRMKTAFSVFNAKIAYHEIVTKEFSQKMDVRSETLEGGMSLITGGHPEEDDDCPICQRMKKAKSEGRMPTEKELQEAFAEANARASAKRSSRRG